MDLSDITRRDLIKLGLLGATGVSTLSLALPHHASAEEVDKNIVRLDESNNEDIRRNNDFVKEKWAEAVKKAEALGSEIVIQPNQATPMLRGFSQIRDVYDFSIFFYGVVEFPIEFWCTYDRQYVGSFWTFQNVYGVGAGGTTR